MATFPIIDSHIHLYPEAEIPTLAWCKPDHPLASEQAVVEYASAAGSGKSLKGYILVEADRKHELTEEGWKYPLVEVAWMSRVATGNSLEDEDFDSEDAKRCLAIIPWAPVPSGEKALEQYLQKVEEAAGEAWGKVKGFRYLLQDKPHGTMLTEKFVEGIKYLGKRGFIFEIGVDQHRRGKKQLDELVELISRAHEDVPGEEKTTFIINHMCKPDLTIYNLADKGYSNWRTAIYTLSRCEKTYMQLSGGFSEMTDSLKNRTADEIFEAIHPWFGILLATFGPEKLIFGSDWPVCTVGVEENAWEKWRGVVDRMCDMASLSEEKQRLLYAGTAIKAFNLKLDD
ncbi:hypothetical protein jhhlp_006197 [Lomentospora prolificans]|uniref:Amidohydrolase-related domain-containing protein n=1 Tax=Lomentospora prolificans TaxID=41688 RepID=A0A2N3N574_9PEZI|nr:hypothetical protein jhhlp_006197 [Lomentospora prolificans]